MSEYLGTVESRSGALIIYGLDFIEVAEPRQRVATMVPGVTVIREPESWGLEVECPCDASFAVEGERSSAVFGTWDRVVIRLAPGTSAERRPVGEVLSIAGNFVVLDPTSAEQLRGPVTHADVACWGSHAVRLADRLGLEQLGADTYGYRDVPIEAAPALEQRIRAATRLWEVARVATHPRTQGYLLRLELQTADSAVLPGHPRGVAFRAHQDGSWPIFAEVANDGSLLALAISFAP